MDKALILGSALLMSGCADPMGHTDGIWPAAGSAQLRNLDSQTIGSDAGYGWGATPGGSGPRAVEVIRQYRTGAGQAADAAPRPGLGL